MITSCPKCGKSFYYKKNPSEHSSDCLFPNRLILFRTNDGRVLPAIIRENIPISPMPYVPAKILLEINNSKKFWTTDRRIITALHNSRKPQKQTTKQTIQRPKRHRNNQFQSVQIGSLPVGAKFYLFKNGGHWQIKDYWFDKVKADTKDRECDFDNNQMVLVKQKDLLTQAIPA